MKRKCFDLILPLLLLIAAPAYGQKSFEEKMDGLYNHTVSLIHAGELKGMDHGRLVILDTRERDEFEISHLKNAQLVSYEGFEAKNVAHISKDAEIIVYCSVGYRSEKIGEKLQNLGYENVKNLYGGIFDWKNKGNEVYNAQNQPTDSVHAYNKKWSEWLYKGIKVYGRP